MKFFSYASSSTSFCSVFHCCVLQSFSIVLSFSSSLQLAFIFSTLDNSILPTICPVNLHLSFILLVNTLSYVSSVFAHNLTMNTDSVEQQTFIFLPTSLVDLPSRHRAYRKVLLRGCWDVQHCFFFLSSTNYSKRILLLQLFH